MPQQTWNSPITLASSRTESTAHLRIFRLDHAAIWILLFVATLAFSHLSSYANQPEQDDDAIPDPCLGMIVHTEMIKLAVPNTLVELARVPSADRRVRTPGDVKRLLKGRGLENLWYVVTLRHRMGSGLYTELSFIRHPAVQWEYYQEFVGVLDRLNGDRASSITDSSVDAPSIQTISDEVATRDPRSVINEILR